MRITALTLLAGFLFWHHHRKPASAPTVNDTLSALFGQSVGPRPPVPPEYCHKNEAGYFIFLGPDNMIGFSKEFCEQAVINWNKNIVPDGYPYRTEI